MTQVEIIVADVDDQKSINAMTKKGKVIINCTGPYRFYGESVVKACIEEGIHYVDVTGEPEVNFLYNFIFLKYTYFFCFLTII